MTKKEKEKEQDAKWGIMLILTWIVILIINWRFGIGLGIIWQLSEIKGEIQDIKKLINEPKISNRKRKAL